MRGAHANTRSWPRWSGIIPADAGSTRSAIGINPFVKDHPRRCGEHSGAFVFLPAHDGSSPQMRGAPDGAVLGRRPGGIIPADAGSTCSMTWVTLSMPDHPRRCGEHLSS